MSSTLSYITKSTSNVSFTLPITCQICLGKVKEPAVCPNLHVFCSFCIDIWLEKNKQCPTCRIPITSDQPIKRILGGYDSKDDMLVPTDFAQSSTRKARFYSLFQQYEDEITRLLKQVDTLTNEVAVLKELNNDTMRYHQASGTMGVVMNQNGSPQHDMIQMLKNKLQQVQFEFDEQSKDKEKLKEVNKKLESENSLLMQDIQRLKMNINEAKAQLTGRFTVAALETKIENYEKEIKQLQKALEKSDTYINELETNYNKLNTNNNLILKSNNLNDYQQFIKNELKSSEQSTTTCLHKFDNIDQTTVHHAKLTNSISNDKFYGSPVKTQKYSDTLPLPPTNSNTKLPPATLDQPKKQIESFTDRLKKSYDLEIPSPLVQSFSMDQQSMSQFDDLIGTQQGGLSSSSSTAVAATSSAHLNRLNSPMKRLRLDEFSLEKPALNGKELNNSLTSEFNDCLQLLNEAETKVNNRGTSGNSQSHHHHHQQQQQQGSFLNSSSFTLKSSNNKQIKFLLPDKYYQEIRSNSERRNFRTTNRTNSNENLNFLTATGATATGSSPAKDDFTFFTSKQKHSPSNPIHIENS